ncbi:TBC1 domain family member 24 [Thelohanellus kitauei]|uniref:TBC1 domain family member 24 n=1 Tax=Thelohanellus kitauei TaxID=669202 RepID=A0A0C2MYH9_THEKT|nr:TBC1 domain family member 24 [Thelohanellus kitauei]
MSLSRSFDVSRFPDYFNPSCPSDLIRILLEGKFEFPFSLSAKESRILSKMVREKSINFENRRQVWLRLSGGEDQIRKFNAEEVFNFKCEELKEKKLLLQMHEYGLDSHDCLTTPDVKDTCCLNYISENGISHTCTNPCCGVMYQVLTKNFISCCIYFHVSKYVSSLAIECDPYCINSPMLHHLCNVFTLVYQYNYQVYASLVGILKNREFEHLDKSLMKSVISSHVLRYFILKLVKKQFCSKPKHPLLLQLYKCHFNQFYEDFSKSANFWIFIDWHSLLFQNLSTGCLIIMIDAFMVKGVSILYRVALFYFYLLFKKLNSNVDMKIQEFDIVSVQSLLSEIIRSRIDHEIRVKGEAMVKKLHVTAPKLTKKYEKIMALVTPLCGNINRLQSLQHAVGSGSLNDIRWPSDVIDSYEWALLMSWLPDNVQLRKPVVAYSSNSHGWCLRKLYEKSETFEPIIIIIKTQCRSVFGGYITEALINRTGKNGICKCFGTGETFVFSLRPEARKYHWVMIENPDTNLFSPKISFSCSLGPDNLKFENHPLSRESRSKVIQENRNEPLNSSTEMHHKKEITHPSCQNIGKKENIISELFSIADDSYLSVGGG